MKTAKVAFQGERGSFSEEAACKLLGKGVRGIPCETFAATFRAVSRGRANCCLVPIENTLAGSIYENYDHLLENRLQIIGEVNLRIVHNLIAFSGTTLAGCRKVYSHPVALAQCTRFLSKHRRIEKIPFYDTAGSVRMLAEKKIKGAAGIASRLAAAYYKGRILRTHLEDHRENYTRFLLLSKSSKSPPKGDKTSLVFSTRNIPGALLKCLSVFALREIDLTKIESRPLRGRPWEYLFYVDFAGHRNDEKSKNALSHLGEVVNFLRILGCYKSASRN